MLTRLPIYSLSKGQVLRGNTRAQPRIPRVPPARRRRVSHTRVLFARLIAARETAVLLVMANNFNYEHNLKATENK